MRISSELFTIYSSLEKGVLRGYYLDEVIFEVRIPVPEALYARKSFRHLITPLRRNLVYINCGKYSVCLDRFGKGMIILESNKMSIGIFDWDYTQLEKQLRYTIHKFGILEYHSAYREVCLAVINEKYYLLYQVDGPWTLFITSNSKEEEIIKTIAKKSEELDSPFSAYIRPHVFDKSKLTINMGREFEISNFVMEGVK